MYLKKKIKKKSYRSWYPHFISLHTEIYTSGKPRYANVISFLLVHYKIVYGFGWIDLVKVT